MSTKNQSNQAAEATARPFTNYQRLILGDTSLKLWECAELIAIGNAYKNEDGIFVATIKESKREEIMALIDHRAVNLLEAHEAVAKAAADLHNACENVPFCDRGITYEENQIQLREAISKLEALKKELGYK